MEGRLTHSWTCPNTARVRVPPPLLITLIFHPWALIRKQLLNLFRPLRGRGGTFFFFTQTNKCLFHQGRRQTLSEVQSSSKDEIKRGQMESLHWWWVPESRPGTPHSGLTVYLCTPTAFLKAAKLAPSKPRYFQSNRTELTAANKHEKFQHDWFVWTYKQLKAAFRTRMGISPQATVHQGGCEFPCAGVATGKGVGKGCDRGTWRSRFRSIRTSSLCKLLSWLRFYLDAVIQSLLACKGQMLCWFYKLGKWSIKVWSN